MRFLVVGLVLVGLGIAVTEYTRRTATPSSEKPAEVAKKPAPKKVEPPPTSRALLETQPLPDVAAGAGDDASAALAKWTPSAPSKDELAVVLAGPFAVREVRAGPGFAVAAVEKDGQRLLVRLSKADAPKALASRKAAVTALATDGDTVVWAEGGDVFQVPAAGGEVKALASLKKGVVASLAVKGALVLAALTPRDADPFAADPNGAVVKLDGGTVTAVATELVRPKELLTDGNEAWLIAGYPSGLTRAALDGSFSARIVDRADGPLAFDDDGLVFRAPLGGGSELKHTARAGGSMRTVAAIDADFAAAGAGTVTFSSSGISPRLYAVSGGGEPKELLPLKGTVKGLAASGATVVLAVTDDGGTSSLRVK